MNTQVNTHPCVVVKINGIEYQVLTPTTTTLNSLLTLKIGSLPADTSGKSSGQGMFLSLLFMWSDLYSSRDFTPCMTELGPSQKGAGYFFVYLRALSVDSLNDGSTDVKGQPPIEKSKGSFFFNLQNWQNSRNQPSVPLSFSHMAHHHDMIIINENIQIKIALSVDKVHILIKI